MTGGLSWGKLQIVTFRDSRLGRYAAPPLAGFAMSGSRVLQNGCDTARLESVAPSQSMPRQVIRVENIVRPGGMTALRATARAGPHCRPRTPLGFSPRKFRDLVGDESCYAHCTVQPGTAMTVKEIGPATVTWWAFSSSVLFVANRNHRGLGSQSSAGRARDHCTGSDVSDPQSLHLGA